MALIGVLKEPLHKTLPVGLPKPKRYIPFEPATPDIGIHPTDVHTQLWRGMCTRMSTGRQEKKRTRNNLSVHQ